MLSDAIFIRNLRKGEFKTINSPAIFYIEDEFAFSTGFYKTENDYLLASHSLTQKRLKTDGVDYVYFRGLWKMKKDEISFYIAFIKKNFPIFNNLSDIQLKDALYTLWEKLNISLRKKLKNTKYDFTLEEFNYFISEYFQIKKKTKLKSNKGVLIFLPVGDKMAVYFRSFENLKSGQDITKAILTISKEITKIISGKNPYSNLSSSDKKKIKIELDKIENIVNDPDTDLRRNPERHMSIIKLFDFLQKGLNKEHIVFQTNLSTFMSFVKDINKESIIIVKRDTEVKNKRINNYVFHFPLYNITIKDVDTSLQALYIVFLDKREVEKKRVRVIKNDLNKVYKHIYDNRYTPKANIDGLFETPTSILERGLTRPKGLIEKICKINNIIEEKLGSILATSYIISDTGDYYKLKLHKKRINWDKNYNTIFG